ncbi:MAG: tyrosine-type recombinase/integrase [Desulfobacteraceae bacterium]|nr:tyrosine-type recombinase/integrase [Desulfobacteraceae bacterium]
MTLTDLQVRKMTPKEHRFELLDNNGLYIRIMRTGRKSWVFRYNFEGTARRMTLGSYPAMTLSQAREKHALAVQDVERGIDPSVKAQMEKAKRKASPTFKDLLEEFWTLELSLQPSGKERRRLIEKDVLKPWGMRKVANITRRDAVLLLDGVRKRAPVTANRVQGVLVRMFNFASERGIIEHSPLTGMKRIKEKARGRVLTDEEIKTLWNALDLERRDIDMYRPLKLALKIILLTGQRPSEVAGMKWENLDGDWWTIPEEVTKTREENRVPILPLVAEIIEEARIYSGGTPYVFASSYNQGNPLTVRALSNAIRRHRTEMGITDRFTPHDLRRTLRTRLAELKVSDIVAEKLLGHKLQGMLAIYNRHAYEEEKKQALKQWESMLQKILGVAKSGRNGNVISITEGRRHA